MILGIDAGSKFIKCAEMDSGGKIIHSVYAEHLGNPAKTVSGIMKSALARGVEAAVFTGLHGDYLAGCFKNSAAVDEVSATIEALKYLESGYRYVVNVGASSIKFVELDDNGNFYSCRENSLCAAGTGSFLDEQMRRMNYDYESLATLAFIQDSPDIATRCAVFAKSDLIHRQQEGYSREELWSGLCRGVVITMLQTAFRGDLPEEDTLFCGGLFLNPIARIWVKEIIRNARFLDEGHFLPAIGSAISNAWRTPAIIQKAGAGRRQDVSGRRLLEPRLSGIAAPALKKEYISNENEVRIHGDIGEIKDISLGIDIGSTSTKLVVIDAASKDVIADIYRKTKGNPIEAVKILFDELKDILKGKSYNILSAGTTGSGRRLIGKITGADLIINEITAHYKGATFFDSSIETIFEIGGQDSKYIRGFGGAVVDCNMNYVCAAGTGSFIEEQASRLGYDVREIGDIVLGLDSPHTSDRCTVFMEQDINKLLRDGYSREEALAGVIRAICKNYLNRVVGSRPVTGKKICFQGATARNKGIVSAFENILGREIAVSPHCHVVGAFGAALLSVNKLQKGVSRFKGLNVLDRDIELRYEQCAMCSNNCKITICGFGGGSVESWGYMCGKESLDERKPETPGDHFKKTRALARSRGRLLKSKKPGSEGLRRIGIPEALTMFNYSPLWSAFFNELGVEVVLSGRSSQSLKEDAVSISKSDFCFPVKMGLSHAAALFRRDDIDAVFFPAAISEKEQENGMPRMFCPYVISFPGILGTVLSAETKVDLITPTIDFRCGTESIADELFSRLGMYGFSRDEIATAYKNALREQRSFQVLRYRHGLEILKELCETGKTGIAVIGRPYNLYDDIINLGLNERISGGNIITFPYECLINPDDIEQDIPHMYWNYGKRILNASNIIKNIDNIYPVYFTNFSCGPDSFILSRFEEIMRGKPYLIIELDEHGSETGYLTRIEAFMDVINEKSNIRTDAGQAVKTFRSKWRKKERKLWFPYMIEYTPRMFAAAFRAWGFDSESLPVEDNEAFELGKQNTRGSECLPACTTIGAFLKKMREIDADPSRHALFMPTAQGPCRFGQYSVLHRSILDRNGYGEADIFSPTSTNSYMGMTSGLRRYLFDAMMCGEMLAKCVYRIRPYEKNAGEVDGLVSEILPELEIAAENRDNLVDAAAYAMKRLSAVPVVPGKRPLAGIVGEIYVRSNPFCNNYLLRHIERNGGEAWPSPMSEWVIYTAWMERHLTRFFKKNIMQRLLVDVKTAYMFNRIHRFEDAMREFLPDRMEPEIERVLEIGRQWVPLEFEGEVILTIGRTIAFLEDGADMVVNCAPFGCMPGNITTTIFQKIQRQFKRPIINLFYDGECDVNRIIGVYLNNIKRGVSDEIEEIFDAARDQ